MKGLLQHRKLRAPCGIIGGICASFNKGNAVISTPSLLHAEGLTSIRSERTLFSGVSFTLGRGELLHVEGPNGAGKSTLLRMLAGLFSDYQGAIKWLDGQAATSEEVRRQTLFLGHKAGIKAELSALENLAWQQQLDGVQANAWDLLEQIGLLGLEDIPAQQLSAGQQRRIALTRLWYSPALVWLLDEPFTALDRQGIQLLEQRMQEHLSTGGGIIMTSHQRLSVPAATILLGAEVMNYD
ncbi:heme exporter protein A [Pseudidiomarina planktonica]|uniref:Heme exporter protein A n=1 Tax=Pseudidiomarina planktonica TaxID=1323738 RepID=A0A1Y6EMZ0_9GAMM|nr:heme exporter protein A [Pseudidiomarina planktonica]